MSLKRGRAPFHLSTSRQGLKGAAVGAVCKRFGGVSVWAASEQELESGVDEISEAILSCAKPHLSITKVVLRKLVRDLRNDIEISDRLFSAILGSALRYGQLDVTVCAAETDRSFRVLHHVSQLSRFAEALSIAERMLREHKTVPVRTLESTIFGARAYNTWSSTAHVLGRLSYLGVGRMDEHGNCTLIEGVAC